MSSFGGQWRIIRSYLSMTNIHTEVEKLVQKLRPSSPEQWNTLIRKFEKVVSSKLSQDLKELEHISQAKPNKLIKDENTQAKLSSDNDIPEKEVPEKEMKKEEKRDDFKEITVEGFFQGLRLKKDIALGKIIEPTWKNMKPTVSKSSIHARTAYVISALVSAESLSSLHKRTENFIEHLKQYPEARDYAIKEGGVRALLRAQYKIRNCASEHAKEIKGCVTEALALMGYTGPTKGPGPNILSIDGGGIRGLIAIEVLRHLEKLTGRKVHELFDFIIGVSTGAIIASVVGSGVGTLDTANEMYMTLSKKMFGNTSVISGTSRLVWSHAYYDTEAWEQLLQDNLGNITLTECNRNHGPKLALVSTAGCQSSGRLTPFVFRSYSPRYRTRTALPGHCAAPLWLAVRASAAAPTYFHDLLVGDTLHQDGGIMVNNPAGVGVHEAKMLFGAEAMKKACLVSVGTGRMLSKHLDQFGNKIKETPTSTSWREKFNRILDSATDTEGVHLILNDLLSPGSYFRFNPPLMEEVAMDEINPDKLKNLVCATQAYIRRNQHKFEEAALRLTAKRSIAQRLADYVHYRSQIWGIASTK